ncbi:zinc metalloproteinase nas-13-like [Pomacea canaliculata]|uniref:zinc metalloproteinase nas-13-like n=1 Tax=Pomacea canaliculata TaxID=400727 RepID=UPI000D7336DF|nr:zinc metalloproteinase nas-13-like [Pomacea canaliculata]
MRRVMPDLSCLRLIGCTLLWTLAVTTVTSNEYLAAEPYKDILSDPNFKPKPEVIPNKTIDQLITEAYGGLKMYMTENFLDLSGDITVELDLVLTSDQFKSMYLRNDNPGTEGARYKRKAARPTVLRWPNRVIPYEFVYSHFNVDEIFYIQQAMQKWQNETCLTFKPFSPTDTNRIRFQNGNGCNSQLGMVRGVQHINLESPGCRFSGLYLHEIGHAIGLVHEHQLPDRDQFIRIIYDNVAPSMRVWFNKYSPDDVNQYGVPYEYSSVMHYGITAFSKDGYSQTIQTHDPTKEKEIGRVYLKGLSFTDIKVVNKMYECNKNCSVDSNCKEPAYLDKNCKCVRPEDFNSGVVTTPTTGGRGGCSNNWNDDQCDGWAEDGECDHNPNWMKENCKKSCGVCGTTTKPDEASCKNIHNDQDCESWARRGECDKNPSWMKPNCKKSCKICSGSGGTDGGGSKPDESSCENIWGDTKCESWADSGECEANPMWMRENCKKACKACTGTTDVCVDNNRYCESWARSGYCATNWFTAENCKKTCGTCDTNKLNEEVTTKSEGESGSGSTKIQVAFSTLIIILAALL